MLLLSQSAKRTLERIEKTIEKDIKNGIVYPSTIPVNSISHVGPDTTIRQLQFFKAFKKSLETGANKLMQCEDIAREDAMLDVIDAIWEFYEPFTSDQKLIIENDAVIDEDLIKRLELFSKKNKENRTAKSLNNFLQNPCTSAWGQDDLWCGIREFKLVETLDEYENILHTSGICDITTDKSCDEKTEIRLAFYRISAEEIIKKKGLYRDYIRFVEKYLFSRRIDVTSAIQKYKMWYDIRTIGIYYIYIPDTQTKGTAI